LIKQQVVLNEKADILPTIIFADAAYQLLLKRLSAAMSASVKGRLAAHAPRRRPLRRDSSRLIEFFQAN
jgi:hypothetical protein